MQLEEIWNMRGMRVIMMVLVVALGVIGVARAEESGTSRILLLEYEEIRLALVGDSLAEVEESADAMERQARKLLDDFDATSVGVAEAEADAAKALLGEIEATAGEVATAEGLEAVRSVFFDLSKPMGRLRKLTGDRSTIVVYCPMAKKAWLQPAGDLGNPYLGTEMPDCGNRIPDREGS